MLPMDLRAVMPALSGKHYFNNGEPTHKPSICRAFQGQMKRL